jgi:hypothetical protein
MFPLDPELKQSMRKQHEQVMMLFSDKFTIKVNTLDELMDMREDIGNHLIQIYKNIIEMDKEADPFICLLGWDNKELIPTIVPMDIVVTIYKQFSPVVAMGVLKVATKNIKELHPNLEVIAVYFVMDSYLSERDEDDGDLEELSPSEDPFRKTVVSSMMWLKGIKKPHFYKIEYTTQDDKIVWGEEFLNKNGLDGGYQNISLFDE